MHRCIRNVILTGIVILSYSPAHARTRSIGGTVVRVEQVPSLVVVRGARDRKDLGLQIRRETKISRGNERIGVADLKSGQAVLVVYDDKGLVASSIRIVRTTTKKKAGAGATSTTDKPVELPNEIMTPNVPSRLVELTAHLRTKNQSATRVKRSIFRLTIPPDLDYQRCVLVASDVKPHARKPHKTGANEYFEFHQPVGPNNEATNDVSFLVLLIPVDYSKTERFRDSKGRRDKGLEQYRTPSRYIESNATEIQQAADSIFKRGQTEIAKARSAYEFPSAVLKFELQSQSLGALEALRSGVGDCTEYSCLFSALCRTQSIPARRVGVFNLGSNQRIEKRAPNHHIAEVYLSSHGWIPVDANLGKGRYDRNVGFGKLGNTLILLNREGAWVWSTSLPSNGYDRSKEKPKLRRTISWDAEVVEEGSAVALYQKLLAAKATRTK